MGNANYRRGVAKENLYADRLEDDGWVCAVTRGSHGAFDVMASKQGERTRLVQVKSTRTPFASFGPAERRELKRQARAAGAVALLAWFPPRSNTPQEIPVAEWPQERG